MVVNTGMAIHGEVYQSPHYGDVLRLQTYDKLDAVGGIERRLIDAIVEATAGPECEVVTLDAPLEYVLLQQ